MRHSSCGGRGYRVAPSMSLSGAMGVLLAGHAPIDLMLVAASTYAGSALDAGQRIVTCRRSRGEQ
jgi:hypothetical protein